MTFMEKVELFNLIMSPFVNLASLCFAIWAVRFAIKTFRE